MEMKRTLASICGRALIQGGAFRLDKGPTRAELDSFKAAVEAFGICRQAGRAVELGCIVNDLGVVAGDRPKTNGRLTLPRPYHETLQQARIGPGELRIWYESTLRNRATADARKGRSGGEGIKINERKGILVPVCAGIMGRFYRELADEGIMHQIGFYAWEEEGICDGKPDRSCPLGPQRGTDARLSGYVLRIHVTNYWVYAGGTMDLAISADPEGG